MINDSPHHSVALNSIDERETQKCPPAVTGLNQIVTKLSQLVLSYYKQEILILVHHTPCSVRQDRLHLSTLR